MVDLPAILEDKAKEKREMILQQIMIILATNGRVLPDDKYQELMNQIIPKESETVENQFNREKFEQLRMLTNMGINRK